MANMQKSKTPMPERDAAIRARCYDEVALGYTEADARNEAARCLDCKHKPCVGGCPVGVDIPAFIKHLENGEHAAAYAVLSDSNALPAVCGRVCPQESQCEARCVRGIKDEPVAIGRLERYAADMARETHEIERKSVSDEGCHKVAIIGSGPASLTCAGELAKKGHKVTVFEAFHTAGGVLVYGIPEFRLPKSIVAAEIDGLKRLGVDIKLNTIIGRTLTVDDLFADGYAAVFIGTGAGLPKFMGIPGESLNGVYSANEYLTRVNLMKAYLPETDTPLPAGQRVAVVGGGNVAMDAARCAVRGGADVAIIYRRSMDELPARAEEVHHAIEEGVVFKTLTNPLTILGNDKGSVCGLVCSEMELGEPDASGRRSPVVTDRTFELEVDMVIMALGTAPNPLISGTTRGLEVTAHGLLTVDDDLMTTRPGVFAGGDAVTGAATVILAMGAGKKAAASIERWINR